MKVPFVDLYAQHRAIHTELVEAFDRVLRSSHFVLGPEVRMFEEAFALYLGAPYAVAVNSGTSAIHLALMALEIGPGHEVITVPNTFAATAEAICAVGARPVFVDVDPATYTMDPTQLERAITKRTKAIIPVHLYGHPADLDALLEVASQYKLHVVEDACQAHGADLRGRKVGTLGTAGCFSFYPSKNLGCCGEGGAIVTSDSDLARRLSMLRNHGSSNKYEHRLVGHNFRMEGLQAAVLSIKLRYLDSWNQERRMWAGRYNSLLAESGLITPTEAPGARHVFHLYVVKCGRRDALKNHLAGLGIETGLHYPVPLHLQEAFRFLGYQVGAFPVAEELAQRCLSLPLYPQMTSEAVEYVASTILAFRDRLQPVG
jgi:dTDP-4-amino-4,6-dideoxygalactose transaminase